jgi:heme oxygenase (biliverdin-producing, ferredoxin)
MSQEDLNLSLPLSTLLKVHTRDAHNSVQNLPAASLLIKGELSREDYVRYLMVLWHVYK